MLKKTLSTAISLMMAFALAFPVGALAATDAPDPATVLTVSDEEQQAEGSARADYQGSESSGYAHDQAVQSEYGAGGEKRAISLVAQSVSSIEANMVKVASIAGDNRNATAAAIARKAYPNGVGSHTVVLVGNSDDAWSDAMTAAPLAAALDAPILYTTVKSLPAETSRAIDDLGIKKVIIIGGTAVVGTQIADVLRSRSIEVSRLSGADRFITQMSIYNYGKGKGYWNGTSAVVASGTNFPDSLSISPVACKQKMPIFLASKKGTFNAAQTSALKNGKLAQFVIVGGTSAVPASVDQLLKDIAASNTGKSSAGAVTRLAGATRYSTSAEIAKWAVQKGYLSWTESAFASGEKSADALAGSVYQSKHGAPILLIAKTGEDVLPAVSGKDLQHVSVFGGTAAVSQDVREDIAVALGFEVTNIEGFKIGYIPDVSHWDTFSNLDTFIAHSEFVIVKCTQGTHMKDPMYNRIAAACNAAGRAHWDYTFMEAWSDPVEQAKFLIANSNGATGFVLDVEDYQNARPTGAQVDKAARYIVSRGYKCIVYYMDSEASDYRWVALQSDIYDRCANWCARYGVNDGTISRYPTASCDIHQYTSVGAMPGVKGNCDLSRYTGTGKSLAWFRTR